MLSKLWGIWALDPSRRRQSLSHIYQRYKTAILFKRRLRGCGQHNIIASPLFWTPEWITLGSGCHIWPGSRIEGISRYANQCFNPHIIVGNNVGIQQNCHITAASVLIIGNDVNVLCGAVITDIDHGYEEINVNFANQPIIVKDTHIGDNCFIGAGARILAGTKLGANCIVGANAVVRGNFPSGTMLAGIPARIIKRYDQASKSWRHIESDSVNKHSTIFEHRQ
jgi:acetyltransferase-like isoleucine patch superfamily enzyme